MIDLWRNSISNSNKNKMLEKILVGFLEKSEEEFLKEKAKTIYRNRNLCKKIFGRIPGKSVGESSKKVFGES